MARAMNSRRELDPALKEIDRLIGTHGVEAIRGDAHVDNYFYDVVALYCNAGDTYTTTILYDTDRNRFYVTSWGDWVETAERTKRYIFS